MLGLVANSKPAIFERVRSALSAATGAPVREVPVPRDLAAELRAMSVTHPEYVTFAGYVAQATHRENLERVVFVDPAGHIAAQVPLRAPNSGAVR